MLMTSHFYKTIAFAFTPSLIFSATLIVDSNSDIYLYE